MKTLLIGDTNRWWKIVAAIVEELRGILFCVRQARQTQYDQSKKPFAYRHIEFSKVLWIEIFGSLICIRNHSKYFLDFYLFGNFPDRISLIRPVDSNCVHIQRLFSTNPCQPVGK